nr:hypothetical protein [Tanacetum cinerariifolium]
MPHRYMCQARLSYSNVNPPFNDFCTHSIAAMDLINQYIYPRIVKGDIPLEILVKWYCTEEFRKTARYKLSIEKRSKILQETIDKGLFEFAPIKAKEIRHKNKIYSHITTSKEVCKETKPFIVANLETILVNDIPKPYAAGLMEFKDRSDKVLYEIIHRIEALGHADAYIPYGENLYYYDVNPLYPFVMKEYPMPGRKAHWIDSIKEEHLDTMLGFVLAYVECHTDIKRPLLPYRDATGTLIFPTVSYVYKILMNSLYGRFGVNPLSSKTLIDQWKPPSNSAVQLSAAITASVRIHTYLYISMDDCYYTDADSVVLGNSLNEEELSLTELVDWLWDPAITSIHRAIAIAYGLKPGRSIHDQDDAWLKLIGGLNLLMLKNQWMSC